MTRNRRSFSQAFSLVELMISMALGLLILLGVNYVFRSTQQTVSTGLALSTQMRSRSSVSDTLQKDFTLAMPGNRQPAMVIHSYSVLAYNNKGDQAADRDGKIATADIDANSIEGESTVPGEDALSQPATANPHRHRVDTFSFFAQGTFQRQTGQPGPGSAVLVSDMSTQEAWIWYGHCMKTSKSGNYFGPGEPPAGTYTSPDSTSLYITNPNDYSNSYASNWTLGRMAILLQSPDPNTVPPNQIFDNNGNVQVYLYDDPFFATSNIAPNYTLPMIYDGTSRTSSLAVDQGTFKVQTPSYDLAGTDTDTLYDILNNRTKSPTSPTYNPNWWWLFVYPSPTPPTATSTPDSRYRFAYNPVPALPYDPTGLAKTIPGLVDGCTQFIVEYAGDFLNQNPTTGQILAPKSGGVKTDGQIDFYLPDPSDNTHREIRWYGAPRDVSRNPGSTNPKNYTPDGSVNWLFDVVPLNTVLSGAVASGFINATDVAAYGYVFEKEYPTVYPLSATASYRYTAAWGPNDAVKPKLIRITIETTDPNGRLSQPITQQYILQVR